MNVKNLIGADSVMRMRPFLVVALAASFVCSLSSCSDDDDEEEKKVTVTLSSKALAMYHNQTKELSVAEDVEVEWSTTDPYVATVDQDGVVTGHFKGVAYVVATPKGGEPDSCAIAVIPLFYTYQEPYLEWGKGTDDVVAGQDLAKEVSNEGQKVAYYDNSGTNTINSVQYAINPDKGLYYAGVRLNGDYLAEVYDFLAERYLFVGTTNGVGYYVHGVKADEYDFFVTCENVRSGTTTRTIIQYYNDKVLKD